jgi:hypothetical protein
MDGSGGSIAKFFGGITTIVLVGVVLTNYKGVAQILNGLGSLYKAAASAGRPA